MTPIPVSGFSRGAWLGAGSDPAGAATRRARATDTAEADDEPDEEAILGNRSRLGAADAGLAEGETATVPGFPVQRLQDTATHKWFQVTLV